MASSLPLEFEVAKLLVLKKFSVISDYSYSRSDSGMAKDFSVDIHATSYVPFNNPNKLDGEVVLLCECKHRTPDTKWLFLPDPNQPDLSPVTVGETIRVVDDFCMYDLDQGASESFDAELDYCYKGVEIKIDKGDVFDTEIKHGIAQLQYALPRLLADEIRFNSGMTEEYAMPFFICPILLTNAELFVVNPEVKMKDVERAGNLEDIAQSVPYLVFYKDYGPDFEAHCRNEFANFKKSSVFKKIIELEKAFNLSGFYSPTAIVSGLENAERYVLKQYFTQFIVCNMKSFTKLVDLVKGTSVRAIKNKKMRKIESE